MYSDFYALPDPFAGSSEQKAISIGVLGGIITTTLFIVVFAPFFFINEYRLLKKDAVEANRS